MLALYIIGGLISYVIPVMIVAAVEDHRHDAKCSNGRSCGRHWAGMVGIFWPIYFLFHGARKSLPLLEPLLAPYTYTRKRLDSKQLPEAKVLKER
jgi:hypothetical protein